MTKQEILEAAAEIFSKKGFHATSMKDIARAVNLQKASLYYHVTNKQAILLSLLDHAFSVLIERLESIQRSELAPDIKLRQGISTYLELLTQDQALAIVLLLEYRSLDSDSFARHVPDRDRFEMVWREIIQEGIRKKVFRQTDPSISSRALLGSLNWSMLWFRADAKYTAAEIANQFADIYLEGLKTRT